MAGNQIQFHWRDGVKIADLASAMARLVNDPRDPLISVSMTVKGDANIEALESIAAAAELHGLTLTAMMSVQYQEGQQLRFDWIGEVTTEAETTKA